MPTKYGDFNYTFSDDIRIEQCTSKARKSFPFEGDTTNYILEEDYMVFIEYYDPPKISSRHPQYSNVFFIKDTAISDVGNGTGKFTRTWATLPGYGNKGYVRSEYESFGYSVPALNTAQTSFYQFPVASSTLSNGQHVITVNTGAPPFDALDVEVNKPATIFYIVTDPLNGQQSNRQIVRKTLAVTSNTITVDYISDIGPIVFTGVQRTDLQQNSYTKQIMSRLDMDYWIPGVNCTSVNDIPIIQELQIIDNNTGGRVEYLSDDTTPSVDTWYDYVQLGTWIVVEPSIVRRWQGEIYERTTRYIKATL